MNKTFIVLLVLGVIPVVLYLIFNKSAANNNDVTTNKTTSEVTGLSSLLKTDAAGSVINNLLFGKPKTA